MAVHPQMHSSLRNHPLVVLAATLLVAVAAIVAARYDWSMGDTTTEVATTSNVSRNPGASRELSPSELVAATLREAEDLAEFERAVHGVPRVPTMSSPLPRVEPELWFDGWPAAVVHLTTTTPVLRVEPELWFDGWPSQ